MKNVLVFLMLMALAGCGGMNRALTFTASPPPCDCSSLALLPPEVVGDSVHLGFCLPDTGRTRLILLDVKSDGIATPLDAQLGMELHTLALDIRQYPVGIYFARLTWRDETRIKKFLIRR